jgi:hypothetical protein
MRSQYTRRAILGLGASVALAGCLGGERPARTASSTATTDGPDPTGSRREADPPAQPPTASEGLYVPHTSAALRAAVISGGPPKDGIPAIDDPVFVDASVAEEVLRPDDVVLGVVTDETAAAYPRLILAHHEIVNDRIDGTPVSVTYCPLTGTAQGFERGDTTFGVSGDLVNSNLVMYDRATDSRWPQMLATAIEGPAVGRTLREFDVVWTTWRRWRTSHPDTRVLSRDTGYVRRYDRDPYGSYNPLGGYYARNETMFAPLSTDDRLPNKRAVVGVRTDAGAVAVESDRLAAAGVVDVAVGDDRIVLVYDPALDAAYAYRAPDAASVVAASDGAVVVDGDRRDPGALTLPRLPAVRAMWFAWAGFYPDTTLHA